MDAPGFDEVRRYAFPADLQFGHWAREGQWTIAAKKVALGEGGCSIAYRFHARDVHLVLAVAMRRAIPFHVLLDGETPGPCRGEDTDEEGRGSPPRRTALPAGPS